MQEPIHFYLLPKQIVHFQNLTHCKEFRLEQIVIDTSSEAVLNSLKYRYALKYLGNGCQQLYVLCIPALEHKLVTAKQPSQVQSLPQLIKTKRQTELKGYASGRRSAIFVIGKKLIRYKGCGNDTEGFIFENKGLRGSHFAHTAKRQIYMTNFINNILMKEIKEHSANKPILCYEFPSSIQELGLKNDIKLLPKYCCVFETQGDRRVGTHLISPLEILFLNIVKVDPQSLNQFFKKRERLDEFGLVQLLTDFEMMVDSGEKFLDKYCKGKSFNNYVSIDDCQDLSNKITQVGSIEEVSKQIQTAFTQSAEQAELTSTVNWIQIINIVLQKLGWQMGQIKRIFCENEINWGFFDDHGYFHCNAHLNNFIVKLPQEGQRLTVPLDFDLAFTKDQFINIDISSPLYGERDDATFQQLLLSEYQAMQMSVSGLEIMNFKYSIKQEQSVPSQEVKQGRIIFRDTLIKSFRQGMKKDMGEYERINKLWDKSIKEIKKLVQFCLIVSDSFQT